MSERRRDWQDRRDDIRNDWQDHRGDVRDDWQDWYDDRYPGYGGWYWGFSPGHWGSWDYLWDDVSASLVRSLAPRDEATKPAPATRVGASEPKPVPADAVVGTWAATGRGTSKYSMALDKEGTFTWSFARGTRKQEVKGVYTVEGNVLAMEPDSGGTMLAELTVKAPGSLHFQMIGSGKDDAGLDFTKGK